MKLKLNCKPISHFGRGYKFNEFACKLQNFFPIGAGKIDGLSDTSAAELLVTVAEPGPVVIKLFSCSTQLSLKFFLLINVKMPTIVGILTFVNRKNSILGLSEP